MAAIWFDSSGRAARSQDQGVILMSDRGPVFKVVAMITTPRIPSLLVNLFGLLAIALIASAALASAAGADVYCVDRSDAECTSAEATPQAALAAASSHPGPDKVLLGIATYSTNALVYSNTSANEGVEVAGAGVGQTVITPADTTGHFTPLGVTANSASTVHDLTISLRRRRPTG